MSFDNQKYTIIRNYLDSVYSKLFYDYCVLNTQRVDYMIEHCSKDYRSDWDGKFGDNLIPNTFCRYGDPLFECLLFATIAPLESIIERKLVPTYSYWRLYQKGDVLEKHKDRNSCEISVTMCLGSDGSHPWPIYINDGNDDIAIELNPGDMLLYKGCEVEHWRDSYKGLNHAQVFLHYNLADKKDNNFLDGRPMPAIPKFV